MASTKNDTQCMKEHLQSSLLCVRKEEPRIWERETEVHERKGSKRRNARHSQRFLLTGTYLWKPLWLNKSWLLCGRNSVSVCDDGSVHHCVLVDVCCSWFLLPETQDSLFWRTYQIVRDLWYKFLLYLSKWNHVLIKFYVFISTNPTVLIKVLPT
jgi:hypothetical protein